MKVTYLTKYYIFKCIQDIYKYNVKRLKGSQITKTVDELNKL